MYCVKRFPKTLSIHTIIVSVFAHAHSISLTVSPTRNICESCRVGVRGDDRLEWRMSQLQAIEEMMLKESDAIVAALAKVWRSISLPACRPHIV